MSRHLQGATSAEERGWHGRVWRLALMIFFAARGVTLAMAYPALERSVAEES